MECEEGEGGGGVAEDSMLADWRWKSRGRKLREGRSEVEVERSVVEWREGRW